MAIQLVSVWSAGISSAVLNLIIIPEGMSIDIAMYRCTHTIAASAFSQGLSITLGSCCVGFRGRLSKHVRGREGGECPHPPSLSYYTVCNLGLTRWPLPLIPTCFDNVCIWRSGSSCSLGNRPKVTIVCAVFKGIYVFNLTPIGHHRHTVVLHSLFKE